LKEVLHTGSLCLYVNSVSKMKQWNRWQM